MDSDELSKAATVSLLFSAFTLWVCVFLLCKLAHIRLILPLNVGTCETLPGPSVTLQMVLLVKVGHVRTLPSTRDGTMEITGVWSLALNTVWGRQGTGRGTLPWSLHRTAVVSSTSSNYKTHGLCQARAESVICLQNTLSHVYEDSVGESSQLRLCKLFWPFVLH